MVEIRRTRPIGLFTLIDCRNNPDPARMSSAAATVTRRSTLGDQPSAVGKDALRFENLASEWVLLNPVYPF